MIRRRSTLLTATGILAAATIALTGCAAEPTPEDAAFRMGTQPWLGYGQWYVAEDQGFFTDRDVAVEISNFSADADVNAALAAGRLDMANVGAQAALQFIETGLDVSIVLVLDTATTADAIIAGEGVTSVADLAGKTVAFEEGATSEILLSEALETAGMSFDDITIVPTDADKVAPVLLAGQVDAGVTYEPYITEAVSADRGIDIVQSAADYPGLISDVLVVRNEVLSERGDQVREVLAAWGDAVDFSEENVEAGRAIIAEGVGSNAADLATAFDGVHFFTLAENRELLAGSYAAETLPGLISVSQRIGLLQSAVDPQLAINASFVAE